MMLQASRPLARWHCSGNSHQVEVEVCPRLRLRLDHARWLLRLRNRWLPHPLRLGLGLRLAPVRHQATPLILLVRDLHRLLPRHRLRRWRRRERQ